LRNGYKTQDPGYRSAIRSALLGVTWSDVNNSLVPYMIRNDPHSPFSVSIGYRDGQDYADDSSSCSFVGHVSVPLLQLIAKDDFLVYGSFRGRLQYCLANPNIMVVETKCGGHLGWYESPPESSPAHGSNGGGTSWANVATTDFIAAVLESRIQQRSQKSASATREPMRSRL
jgi:hypothetical protein